MTFVMDTNLEDALIYVTSDWYADNHNDYYRDANFNAIELYWKSINETCGDWDWENVLKFWSEDDIDAAIGIWEEDGCPIMVDEDGEEVPMIEVYDEVDD